MEGKMEPPGDRGERRAKEFSRTNSKNRNSGRNLGRCSCNLEGGGGVQAHIGLELARAHWGLLRWLL